MVLLKYNPSRRDIEYNTKWKDKRNAIFPRLIMLSAMRVKPLVLLSDLLSVFMSRYVSRFTLFLRKQFQVHQFKRVPVLLKEIAFARDYFERSTPVYFAFLVFGISGHWVNLFCRCNVNKELDYTYNT